MEREIVDLVKRVEPSIASLIIQRKYVTVINGQTITDYERTAGSGVVLNGDGYILTTAGLVHQADDILVSFPDGQYRSGDLVGIDPLSGIAVIHVDSVSVVPARMGDSDTIAPGAWVLMLSNAYGMPSSLAFGLVNGIRPEDVLLQISAVISPGFTGGAVFSSEGRLIGLIADGNPATYMDGYTGLLPSLFGHPGAGIVSVIPINRVKTFANHLVRYGEVQRSWLGVYVEKIWDSVTVGGHINIVMGSNEGMAITHVYEGSPAEQAGLKAGDRLLAVNGMPMNHPIMLAEFVTTMPAGSEIEIKYVRDGQEGIAHTRLMPMPPPGEQPLTPGPATVTAADAAPDLLLNPDLFQRWIIEHEKEIEDQKMEIERLKKLWQERVQQVNTP
jgi:S1-C subfamily serine protease